LTTAEINSRALNDKLFLFIGTIALARVAAMPFHSLIVFAVVSNDDTLIRLAMIFLPFVIGCVLYALMILAGRSFFRVVYQNFAPYIHKENFDKALIFGMLFFVLPLPLLTIAIFVLGFLELQTAASLLLLLRLALVCYVAVAHCVFLTASFKKLISMSLKRWIKACVGFIVLCFAFSTVLTIMSFNNFHTDNFIGVAVELAIPEFWILLCVAPYCLILALTFWNLPKRLAAQESQRREQSQDVTISPTVSTLPMFVSVRKSVREKFEDRQ